MIITGLKKNKIKEESKKKSKKPKNIQKKNHPFFSLMQLHTIFNTKMQCNVFLPHVLLTCCQFQHLKYSVCPSVYTDALIFTRNKLTHYSNLLFIMSNWSSQKNNCLRWLVRLSINTAYIYVYIYIYTYIHISLHDGLAWSYTTDHLF